MKTITVIMYLFFIQAAFSQKNKVFLSFNFQNEKEISIDTRKYNDTLISKMFHFYKHVPKELYVYELYFDKGIVKKGVKGATSHYRPGYINLLYHSVMHKKCVFEDLKKEKNVLAYRDFKKSKYDSFYKIMLNADLIYIFDKQSKECYEVSLAN